MGEQSGRFLVRRGFYKDGAIVPRGDIVTLSDASVIGMLLELNRIVPADEDTRRRLGRVEIITWEPPRDPHPSRSPWQELPSGLSLAAARQRL